MTIDHDHDLLLAHRGDPADLIAPDSPVDAVVDLIRRARPPWMAAAACARPDAPSMFPEGRGVDVRPALTCCQSCPVLDRCRDWCIRTDPDPLPHGIAAGMTARARRQARRSRKATP